MTTYSQDLKDLVIADYKAGASLGQLAKTHGIAKTTAHDWTHGVERTIGEPKTDRTGPSLDEMAWSLVGGAFVALGRIQGITTDETWLHRQDASQLAILYGVISDKLVRLLGAARQREADDAEPAGQSGRIGAEGQ